MPDTGSITELDQNTYNEKTNSFTGDIIYYTWQGTPLVYARYENGERKESGYVEQTSKKTGARINECYVTEVRWYSVACSAGSCGDPVYLYSDFYYFCSGPGSNPNDAEDPGDLYGGGGGNGSGGYTPTVDDWEATINDTQLKPCMQTIVADLKNISQGSVGQIIQRFSGNTPGFNWILNDGNLTIPGSPTPAGQTSPLYNKSSRTVTTTFDSQSYLNATELSWARTILHESIHAYLIAYFNIDQPNFIKNYPQMVQDWGVLQNWNAVHHEEFARSLVNAIADALQEYGNLKGYTGLNRQFYEDMSWAGLQTTSAFQGLPLTDQTRILDTIYIELTGKDSQSTTKIQKGTNAGC